MILFRGDSVVVVHNAWWMAHKIVQILIFAHRMILCVLILSMIDLTPYSQTKPVFLIRRAHHADVTGRARQASGIAGQKLASRYVIQQGDVPMNANLVIIIVIIIGELVVKVRVFPAHNIPKRNFNFQI